MSVDKREKVLTNAEKLVARGKLSQAIKEYRKLLREAPDDANMLNRVGDLYARQDRVGEAIILFEKIARTYGRDGFLVKAIAIYKKIIRLDPTRLEIYEHLAELYHRQGLVSEARSQYQVLADYYQKHGDRSSTLEVHRKMADLEPNDPSPRVKLAELYLQEGLLEETIGEYQRIAEVMLDHDRVEEATKVYLRALDVDSGDLTFISEAVLRLREDGHAEAAAQVFEAAVERNPEAAQLAERMREHAKGEVSEADGIATAAAEVEAADEIDVADVLQEAAAEDATSPPQEAVEEQGDGAFVIDMEDEVEEAPADSTLVESSDELEIDLGRLEAPARLEADGADPMAEIDELAASLGLEGEAVPEPDTGLTAPAESAADVSPGVDEIEAPGTELVDEVQIRLAELIAEAEVFAKYGLESKAARRLEQVLEVDSTHFEAHRRLVFLYIEKSSEEAVIQAAQRMLDEAEVGGGPAWEEVLAALSTAGFQIDDGRVGPLGAGGEAAPAAAEQAAAEAPLDTAEEGLEWLEEAAKREEGQPEALFEVEDEFFDLAAELEKEIADETALGREAVTDVTPTGEESLEDIVAGFKQGVAEVLSPEAYETHYNLGIAYREMGLVDEAIGEFQLSAKDPEHLVDSCSLLGACFLEKGFPDLAVKWYKRGLEIPDLDEEGTLSLLYDLGDVHAISGEREAAYEIFVEIYGINSHYRDVVARLEELRAG